jgi:hypothetical protein
VHRLGGLPLFDLLDPRRSGSGSAPVWSTGEPQPINETVRKLQQPLMELLNKYYFRLEGQRLARALRVEAPAAGHRSRRAHGRARPG